MTFLRRVPLIHAPSPAEVLSPAELARCTRYKAVYQFAGALGIDCLIEARELYDHLEFLAYLSRTGRTK